MPEPRVYLDYTQAALDRAYDQRSYAPNADAVIAWYGEASARARAAHPHRLTLTYGPSADEILDVFQAARPGAPIHVHLHGGGWRNLTKDEESFLANTFVPAGATLAILNFATIPKVRLPEMIAQARRAIAWIHENAASFGGDPDRIHISGHSSGGHMAAVLATTDWASACGLPADVVKTALLMSGMYDLAPVMLSARGSYVKLSEDEVAALSPIRHIDRIRAPLLLVYGDRETPEFQRQPEAFAAAARHADKDVTLLTIAGVNHFELLQLLDDPRTGLARAALRLMRLAD